MPNRHHARARGRVFRLAAVLGAFAVVATIGGAPASGDPNPGTPPKAAQKHTGQLGSRIRTLNAELDRLSRRNDQLDEQYNLAAAAVTAAQRTAERARNAADAATASYLTAHARFVAAVTQQYEGGSTPSVGTLLTSGEPQQYLDTLTMNSYLAGHFADTVRADRELRAGATLATRRADAALAAARGKQAALANRRADVREQAQR
ncbi:MAG: hypothetical protein QOJ34_1434, partial [Pseudonocardiales bacterium]|nr:hypothetical protein [Pseudonocardiales bacterium]